MVIKPGNLLLLITAMGAAYGLARWLTGVARAAGLRWGVMSHVTTRSSHTVPTPRLGGAGLALGFGLAAAIYLGLPGRATPLANPAQLGWVGLGWGLMFAVGLLDDLFDLPPLLKLALELAGALVPTLAGGVILQCGALPGGGPFLPLAGLTTLWILFFTNGYNFMDGMDGFAGRFAQVAATALFAVILTAAWRRGVALRAEAGLPLLLAAACGGFLQWNRPPARVFMGDGGSLSTGYLLAIFPVLGQRGTFGPAPALATAGTILLPFIFDVTLTLIRRLRRGENILKAHREHLYQRLMRTGLSHAAVLRRNEIRFALCALLAWAGAQGGTAGAWLGLAGALGVMLEYWRAVVRRERAAASAGPSRP
jgi:UDP-N-acetylmuramyl pentapeptide phosphotransferase/UDP-N-acetylglucosamine-1-phosphate transferase